MANEIYGNLKGIRNSVIEELKTFYDILSLIHISEPTRRS